MIGTYCLLNNKIIKATDAMIPIDHIEFTYGFGVYENLRMRNFKIAHVDEHIKRLFESADLIHLIHHFDIKEIIDATLKLVEKNNIENANIKMILVGGENPLLYTFMLAPKYLEKKEYRDGVKVISYHHERFLPQVKSLNMLPSYIIYKLAQKQNAYDALLIDRNGNISEGTRSNFFAIKNTTLYTPPREKVLNGITRRTVIKCAQKNNFEVSEQEIPLETIFEYDGAFLTNTSGKIVPIRTIDGTSFEKISLKLMELKKLYDAHLSKEA
ncbi:MAG: aminotransferase class IV family protein [Candidatus Magasanikbacteria bacterium]|nr:aminotransferase class IV family protein [Candidatus Magasanikbacteria bacterium]